MDSTEAIVFGIAAVLTLSFFIWSIALLRKLRAVSDTPTSKCKGVFIGVTEVKGTAESEEPLLAYLSEKEVVYSDYIIKERSTRTVTTVEYVNGKPQTRTKRVVEWTTVAQHTQMQLFYLRDETGAILVDPKGADITPKTIFSRTVGLGNPLYYGKGPRNGVLNSDHIRSFTERAIVLHQPVYILGYAHEREDCVAPMMRLEKGYRYMISTQSEDAIVSSAKWKYFLAMLLYGIALIGPFVFAHIEWAYTCRPIVWSSVIFVCLLILGHVYELYNNLIGLRNRVRQAQSLLDIQLKRRYDLIPNLVEVITGMRAHEQTCQTHIAALRSAMGAGGTICSIGADVKLLRESYPNLVSADLFLELQKNLTDTEDRIALSCNYMNEITTIYNTKIATFPNVMIAGLCHARPFPLFQAEKFETQTPELHFK